MRSKIYRLTKGALVLLVTLTGANTSARAQELFNEGIIRYDVTIEGPGDRFEGIKEYKGTYVITIKGAMQRKELKLDNGFQDITIVDGYKHKVYSLRDAGKKNYAIELDNNVLQRKHEPWKGYTLSGGDTKQTIANMDGYKGVVTYKNGATCDIYYSKDWQLSADVYEHFPEINVLPLQYIINTTGGVNMRFKLSKMEATPVEQSVFRVPKNYKIVTYAEYQQMGN